MTSYFFLNDSFPLDIKNVTEIKTQHVKYQSLFPSLYVHQFKRSALHKACYRGHMDIMRKLLEAGASIENRDKVENKYILITQHGATHRLTIRFALIRFMMSDSIWPQYLIKKQKKKWKRKCYYPKMFVYKHLIAFTFNSLLTKNILFI